MPQTWRGTYGGDRDYVTSLRRQADERRSFEASHPEVAGDQRPIMAHEGPYEEHPLRKGDPIPVGDNRVGHGHAHGHAHPRVP